MVRIVLLNIPKKGTETENKGSLMLLQEYAANSTQCSTDIFENNTKIINASPASSDFFSKGNQNMGRDTAGWTLLAHPGNHLIGFISNRL